MLRNRDLHRLRPGVLPALAIAVPVALCALLGRVGADARWLAALGNAIGHGASTSGVPFAAASSAHWPNALVLAELVFGALERAFGDRGLMLAQLLAVASAFAILARDARRLGSEPAETCRALLLAAAGALPALMIARVQLFSLVLFPLLVALLRSQARSPSRRIWLAVPLLALWSNLHGVALLGLVVTVSYLLLARARQEPVLAAAVALSAAASLLLTPALLGTATYYHGLLGNLAAQRGAGMWQPLSPAAPLDAVLILAVAGLGYALRRRRLPLWELVVGGLLLVLTVHASRNGVWLVFFLVPPAAAAVRVRERSRLPVLLRALAPVAAAVAVFGVLRGPVPSGADAGLLATAIAGARGTPILAADGIDEQVALAGGRVLMGNPLDAFARGQQAAYLDWLAGLPAGARAIDPRVNVVLVTRGSAVQQLMDHLRAFVPSGAAGGSVMYERR